MTIAYLALNHLRSSTCQWLGLHHRTASLGWLLFLALFVPSCKPPTSVAEAEYSSKIVGKWLGTVGDTKEYITFTVDGQFVAELRPLGFISNTLSQGETGTVGGTWAISGSTINLNITQAENERLKNSATSSTILTFNSDELKLQSNRGEISTFVRAISL